MSDISKSNTTFSYIQIYAIVLGLLLVLDIMFIFLTQNENKTINLLKKELAVLEQNNQIISSSQEISTKYASEIEVISKVFPSEKAIPEVVKELEDETRANSDNYRLKFNSVTPITELDRLYLPLTLTVNTDLSRLINLLTRFEQLPYLTHINNMLSKNSEGFSGKSEIIISLKLYVQNPFN